MVFDENISDSISLSRVLDHFIVSGEDPETILNFLSMYKDRLDEIIRYSDTSPRLLSYGFVQKCSISQIKKFAGVLNSSFTKSALEVAVLVHQIMAWGIPTERNLFKDVRKSLLEVANIKHPHSGTLGEGYLEFDQEFADAEDGFHYANIVNRFRLDSMKRYMKNCVEKSVVVERLFQEDVFSRIDPFHQYVMLNEFPMEVPLSMVKGIKGILCSGDIEVLVKADAADVPMNVYVWGDFFRTGIFADEEMLLELESADSFNRIAMKLELRGDDRLCDWILMYILMKRGVDFLRPGLRGHRELFKRYFDITDLLAAA